MITLPDRLSGAIAALERGEQVDWRRLADLQALDLVRFGRQVVEEAIARDQQADQAWEEVFRGPAQ